jgi:hypothetical protein
MQQAATQSSSHHNYGRSCQASKKKLKKEESLASSKIEKLRPSVASRLQSHTNTSNAEKTMIAG